MNDLYGTYHGPAIALAAQLKLRRRKPRNKVRTLLISEGEQKLVVTHNQVGEAVVMIDCPSRGASDAPHSL